MRSDDMNPYRVLIVDDSEENLAILRNALSQDYKVSVMKDGAQAINALNAIRPDLILLDVNMPGIDGYETLKRIKRMAAFTEVPVIFVTGAVEIQDKRRGFEAGAVDYITKPFDIMEVKLRVKTHMELSKSREEKKELLGSTLVGTIQALLEILSITNPFAFEYSNCSKRMAGSIARDMGIEDIWKVEIAAMLSLIGTCVNPPGKTEMIICGKNVTLEDRKQFARHPLVGSKLISKIPRLEDLAEMVKNQMEPLGEMDFNKSNVVLSGSQILAVVNNYQNYIHQGQQPKQAVALLKQNRAFNNVDVIRSLERALDHIETRSVIRVGVEDLKVGMVINEDIVTGDGGFVIQKGTAINGLVIEHLKLLSEVGKLQGRICVKQDGTGDGR